jgi:hypothetical protein
MKLVGKPDAGNRHVRFDERGQETECCHMAQATAPVLDSTRRLPPPWHADKFSGGYVVRDANGFAVAYVYGRSTEAEAIEAKQMTMDEARRVASNIAKLPDMLKRGE